MLSVLNQGGPVMYVLLAFSVAGLAILLLKLFEFSRLRLRRDDGCVAEAMTLAEDGDIAQALKRLGESASPVARVLEATLQGVSDDVPAATLSAEIGRVGSREIRALESWLRALSSIGHLSPLLGLLGTVFGMIAAFQKIQEAGSRVDASLLSGGIWEALLTTAFGLAVAIPAMAAFYLLEGEVDRARASMRDLSTRLLVRFEKVPGSVTQGLEAARVETENYGV
ncbi:MAG: biopolymer transport protein ExbB [Hyphomicrobiaceae bacterium]|jgi:biopolymer transport protein ExbB